MSKRTKQDFSTSDAVRAVTRVDGEKNRGGRPVGSTNKGMPDRTKIKTGLLEVFSRSNAPGIIMAMLCMSIPSILRPQNRDMLTVEEDARYRQQMRVDFKWAADFIAKIIPRELGRHGQVRGEMSLAELTRRATVSPKSPKVIEMIARRRNDELESFVADETGE